jgi:hypothetical protein
MTEPRPGLRPPLPLLAATIVVSLLYHWTASAGLPLGFGESRDAPYNLLAHALGRGQLHLPVEPSPALFRLADPYEPGRNANVRLHDASLYHGRYYYYFGVVPAVVAFLPWRLVGLGDLPEAAAAVAFGSGVPVLRARPPPPAGAHLARPRAPAPLLRVRLARRLQPPAVPAAQPRGLRGGDCGEPAVQHGRGVLLPPGG